ncbi:transcriptional regulator [Paenibacillus dendritiformis C454]|uniref:Transcriptional regulator n=1 Tax=Paenibacillus dendritiformis C454 TaxID=1131935 RepID=H3SJN5_9BACL|nr:transcriptional regulator [Paenibacillus dendritiformis C454]
MTQQQLADRLEMSVSVLGEIERGRRRLDQAMMGRIAGELGVTQEELASDPSFR